MRRTSRRSADDRSWLGAAVLLPLVACGGGGRNGGQGQGPGTGGSAISQVTLTPASVSAEIGQAVQFTATVTGTGAFDRSVTWAVNGITNGSGAVGTISDTGLYTTPYPAPASVTVTSTSRADPTKSARATVTLTAPPPAQGPDLLVDAGALRRSINPLIYGMNWYDASFDLVAPQVLLPLERWGGDHTTRYNYQLDVTNAANDWYFTTEPNTNTQYPDVSDVNTMVARNRRTATASMVTVPLIGWTTKRQRACGFSVAKYGAQKEVNPYNSDCGNGVRLDNTTILADPTDTSVPIGPEFVGAWVRHLVTRHGGARRGGVAVYALDNEPDLWQWVHKDVHPAYPGFDEFAVRGLEYARAIKAVDPDAQVAGPVTGLWMGFFYSPQDWQSGWNTPPDFKYWSNPIDRRAHGDVPFIEWYLRQFAAAERRGGRRLLDYLDVHGYLAGDLVQFKPAGDTANQALRLESVRAYWDPSYTVGGDIDDAPALVRRMRDWVARNYPGTRTAITEYNLGALDHINGALAQADLLGVFGREGLDLATIWGPPKPNTPGMFAFKVFRNYDDAGGAFGDLAVGAGSGDQSQLSLYAAERRRDGALTILVVNKTFRDLASGVALRGFSADGLAQVWRYSAAVPERIVRQEDLPIGRTAFTATFAAASITLVILPER